jgi:hypothetical protein
MRKRQLSPESQQSPAQSRLDLPLECQDPDDFGNFDAEQKFLLSNGALDLVLIENAAELMRRVMMKPGNIEKILKLLSKTYEGCGVLPAETFPIYALDPAESWQNTGTAEEYQSAINGMNEQYTALINKKGINCVSAVFGLMVESDGSGHYGSFFLRKGENRVYIFDSMQDQSEGSAYTVFFAQLARDVFGVREVVFDRRFTIESSLQLTGGFSANPPLMLRLGQFPGEAEMRPPQIKSIKLQCTESQNHFCYMWSIWSLHLRMIGKEPYEVAKLIEERRVDPLTVIKRYIWALFNYKGLKLVNQIPDEYRAFFAYHWPAIWSNDPTRQYVRNVFFRRYIVPLDTCNDLTTCINLSYEQLKVINEQNLTPVTASSKELIECARRKK